MHTLALPLIYKQINISVEKQNGDFDFIMDSQDGGNPHIRRSTTSVHDRIRSLARTLRSKPRYGEFVTDLTFTYQSYNNYPRHTFVIGEHSWDALRHLKNVKSLTYRGSGFQSGLNFIQQPLFHSADSINISGRLDYATFMGLVPASGRNIRSLELDDIDGIETMHGGMDIQSESDSIDEIPLVRRRGPMIGHLRYIQQRCIDLQHFSLRVLRQPEHQDRHFYPERARRQFSEVAGFIDSTRRTLETLRLDWTVSAEIDREVWSDALLHSRFRDLYPQHGISMDIGFVEEVYPILLRGPWPNLKEIFIRGVGGGPSCPIRPPASSKNRREDQFESAALRDQLQASLGNDVSITWVTQPDTINLTVRNLIEG